MFIRNIFLIIIDISYHLLIKQILFIFNPESSHKFIGKFLKKSFLPWRYIGNVLNVEDGNLFTPYFGYYIANPIGLAAGFDKDCEYLKAISNFGFGYITIGTVTVQKQYGNQAPRLSRLRNDSALLNSLGFPSIGMHEFLKNVQQATEYSKTTFLTISITGKSIEQMVESYKFLYEHCDAIEINISSPNTEQLKIFHDDKNLLNLLKEINKYKNSPIIVKLPPYATSNINEQSELLETKDNVMRLIDASLKSEVDGFTISNSRPIITNKLASKKGGLSGKLLYESTAEMVEDIRPVIGNRTVINACGGISTGSQAWNLIKLGATTVQLYTSLIYSGITLPNKMNKFISKKLQSENQNNLIEFINHD